jgi:hypothetical protein
MRTRNPNLKQAAVIEKKDTAFDLDEFLGKYFFLIIPILIIFYYFFGAQSTGFYGDDEIGYAMYMKRIFSDPFSILGNWNKPGYRIFFALPSLLGNNFLVLSHIFLTAIIPIGIYYLGKLLKIKNSSVIAILFSFQPFIVQFSFRCYAEMLCGLLIVITLILFYKNRFILSAFCATYLFTVRQEYITLTVILGIIYLLPILNRIRGNKTIEENGSVKIPLNDLLKKNIIPFFILFLGPLLLNLMGFLYSGDLLWLYHDVKHYTVDIALPQQDFFHYFRMYIFVIGPVSFALFITGFFSFLFYRNRFKAFLKQYGIIFALFIMNFLIYAIMASKELNISGGTGALRFMIPLSPLAAIIAGIGLNQILSGEKKKYIYITLGMIILITLLFLSYKTDRTIMTKETEYLKLVFIVLFAIIIMVKIDFNLNSKIFLPLVLVIGIAFTIIDEKPIMLDPERKCLETAAGWIKKNNYGDRDILCNHIYFYKTMGAIYGEDQKIKPLSFESLKEAPKGTIIIWESHYSYFPIYGAKVPSKYIEANPNFKLISFIVSSDKSFKAGLFEKINEY